MLNVQLVKYFQATICLLVCSKFDSGWQCRYQLLNEDKAKVGLKLEFSKNKKLFPLKLMSTTIWLQLRFLTSFKIQKEQEYVNSQFLQLTTFLSLHVQRKVFGSFYVFFERFFWNLSQRFCEWEKREREWRNSEWT